MSLTIDWFRLTLAGRVLATWFVSTYPSSSSSLTQAWSLGDSKGIKIQIETNEQINKQTKMPFRAFTFLSLLKINWPKGFWVSLREPYISTARSLYDLLFNFLECSIKTCLVLFWKPLNHYSDSGQIALPY